MLLRELRIVELAVQTPLGHQLIVTAPPDDTVIGEHDNLVRDGR